MNRRESRSAFIVVFALALGWVQYGCASNATDTRDERTEKLLQRVEQYHTAFAEARYSDAYEMIAERWREGGKDKENWVAYTSRAGATVRIKEWSVSSVATIGDRAKVAVVVKADVAGRDELAIATQMEFWQFERGEWFYIPIQLSDWDDAKAVRLFPNAD